MDCNACIYTAVDEMDPPEFLSATWPSARKFHQCCECGKQIPAGDRYERTVGKWDGEVRTYVTCAICSEIGEAFCCDGWVYGQLWEDAVDGEFFSRMTTGCLEKLKTAAAKSELIHRWQQWRFGQ